jgi:sulfur-oxidizing protein SoxX
VRKRGFILALIVVASLAACGGGSAPAGGGGGAAGGNAGAGEAVFGQGVIGGLPGCMTCHSLEAGVTLVGPSLASIGAEAGSMVSGLSAEEYLRQSIIEPDAYVVEGFGQGLMPAGYGDALTSQQLDDLVAYLLGLK